MLQGIQRLQAAPPGAAPGQRDPLEGGGQPILWSRALERVATLEERLREARALEQGGSGAIGSRPSGIFRLASSSSAASRPEARAGRGAIGSRLLQGRPEEQGACALARVPEARASRGSRVEERLAWRVSVSRVSGQVIDLAPAFRNVLFFME
jgi:hypothetical protein